MTTVATAVAVATAGAGFQPAARASLAPLPAPQPGIGGHIHAIVRDWLPCGSRSVAVHDPKDAAMYRICLCLLICFASAAVTARDFKMSSANGGSCPDNVAEKAPTASARKASVPARETRAKPTVHGDAIGNGRLQSPRWHSYLPGMFR